MYRLTLSETKINPLSANPTKWLNTLKQFGGKLPTNCLSVFDHFVFLALKGLNKMNFRFADQYEKQLNQTKYLHKVIQYLALSST